MNTTKRTTGKAHVSLAIWLVTCTATCCRAESAVDLTRLERSYWVHASLGQQTGKNYWRDTAPPAEPPSTRQIAQAASLLAGPYAANRLYLIYHKEIPIADARRAFLMWRAVTPKAVELVPTLVLRMYDKAQTPVFNADELATLIDFCKTNINAERIAVYDVYCRSDQGPGLNLLADHFPAGLILVGQQPRMPIAPIFTSVVEDTWSGLCHGTRNVEDWLANGFGAQTLRDWISERNAGHVRVAWDLVAVAWDYTATERGGYPGYDDARKNMPLPADRNRLAANLILDTARPEVLAGFSSDLFILHVNSRADVRDGPAGAFYQTLRQGQRYRGYYARPLNDITAVYRALRAGRRQALNDPEAFKSLLPHVPHPPATQTAPASQSAYQ